MVFDEMVSGLFKPADKIKLTVEQVDLLHACVGLVGEVGEVLPLVVQPPKDPMKLVNELGDMEFYMEAARAALDLPMQAPDVVEGYEVHPSLASWVATELLVSSTKLLDLVKKVCFNKRTDLEDSLPKALIEVMMLSRRLYGHLGITPEQARAANMDKLGERYEGFVYSDEAARARRDES